jgi:CRISPR-associated endonuclease/helicase Cas3/CRISPR-associated endonuclease Cas3-HD
LESIRDERGELDETAVARHAVREFYRNLHEEKDVGKQSYADFVDSARADKLAEQSLIDQVPTADVLVCRTGKDRELVNRLGEAQDAYDFEELRRLLSETKPLRISVPYYREDSEIADAIRSLPPLIEDEGIYLLDVRDHGSYFDQRKGFVVPESTVGNQFL